MRNIMNQITLITGAKLALHNGKLHLEGSAAQQTFYKDLLTYPYINLDQAIYSFNAHALRQQYKGLPVPYEVPQMVVAESRGTADGTTVERYQDGSLCVTGTNDEMVAAYQTIVVSNPGIALDELVYKMDTAYLLKYVNDPFTCIQTCETGRINSPLSRPRGEEECLHTPLFAGFTPVDVYGMTPWVFSTDTGDWWCTRENQRIEQLMNGTRYFVESCERGSYVRIRFVSKSPVFDDAIRTHRAGTDIKAYLTNYLLDRVSR